MSRAPLRREGVLWYTCTGGSNYAPTATALRLRARFAALMHLSPRMTRPRLSMHAIRVPVDSDKMRWTDTARTLVRARARGSWALRACAHVYPCVGGCKLAEQAHLLARVSLRTDLYRARLFRMTFWPRRVSCVSVATCELLGGR